LEEGLSARPTVESLTQFLKEDQVVAQTWRAAAVAAGVDQASVDLLIVEEEDVARLFHLDVDDLSKLRVAFERLEPVVAGLLAEWREDSDSELTPQELLWALTYVLAAQGDEPAEQIRALVSNERWWQRATNSHRSRFLDRIVSQLDVAKDPKHDE
jgi:hypothetical protein